MSIRYLLVEVGGGAYNEATTPSQKMKEVAKFQFGKPLGIVGAGRELCRWEPELETLLPTLLTRPYVRCNLAVIGVPDISHALMAIGQLAKDEDDDSDSDADSDTDEMAMYSEESLRRQGFALDALQGEEVDTLIVGSSTARRVVEPKELPCQYLLLAMRGYSSMDRPNAKLQTVLTSAGATALGIVDSSGNGTEITTWDPRLPELGTSIEAEQCCIGKDMLVISVSGLTAALNLATKLVGDDELGFDFDDEMRRIAFATIKLGAEQQPALAIWHHTT